MADDFILNDFNRNAYGELEDREAYTIDNGILEYKPLFKREERERTAWEKPQFDNNIQTPTYDKLGDGVLTDLVKKYDDTKKKFETKLEKIEKKYKDIIIPVLDKLKDDINKALEELNLTGEFTFEKYIKALEQRNTPAGDFLVEVAERQFENLDGNIEMELYHDYYELLRELSVTEDYLYRQAIGKIYKEIDKEKNNWEDILLKEELSWKEERNKIILNQKNRLSIEKNAFLFNPEVYPLQKELRLKEEPEVKRVDTEKNQVSDAIHISENKLNNSIYLFEVLNEVEDISEKDKLDTTIEKLIKTTIEDNKKEENLTQLEQMLTISTENHNEEKRHFKNSLRNVYNEEFLYKNLDELSVYNGLYENSVIPLTSILKTYTEEQDSETTMILEAISNSMINTRKEQKKKTRDFDSLNFATYSIRMQKTNETKQKEKERQTYKILHSILEQIKQGGE